MSRVQTIPVTLRDGTELEGGWVDLFPPIGSQVHYRGEVIEIDAAFAARILANFGRYLTLYGKEPVMLRQHEREGWCYGVWANLRVHEGRIQGLAAFLSPEALSLFKQGQLREWSPGFGDVEDPHTGEMLQDMLVEASFVDRGHQWNLRPPSQTNPVALAAGGSIYTLENIMADETKTETPAEDVEQQLADTSEEEEMEMVDEEEEAPFDMAAAFGALTSTLTAMAEGQAKILAHLEGQAPSEKEEEPANEMAALRSEVAALRRENALKDLAAEGISGDIANGLVELRTVAPKQFEATFAALKEQFNTPVPRVQKPLGASQSPMSMSLTAEKVIELASASVPSGHSIMPWVLKNHPDHYDAVKAAKGLG